MDTHPWWYLSPGHTDQLVRWGGIPRSVRAKARTLLFCFVLKLASGELTPQTGRILPRASAIYAPQPTDHPPPGWRAFLAADADGAAGASAAGDLRRRLGVRDDWADRWPTLSHGERKRAQIGVALWANPELLALDEPTNHMDLPSIACLEEALAACPCALLLVSHDPRFLETLVTWHWHLTPEGNTVRLTITPFQT